MDRFKELFKQYLKDNNISVREAERKLKMGNGTLGGILKREGGMNSDDIDNILHEWPDVIKEKNYNNFILRESKVHYGRKEPPEESLKEIISAFVEALKENRKTIEDIRGDKQFLKEELKEALFTINNHIRTGQTQYKGKASHG
jgi:hypothetical protein